jgi:hypothetical protein
VVAALRLENIVRGHIPDDLALLTGLTLLELVLSDELVGTIPSSLENLTILRRLALSGTIPPSLFSPSLTALTDLYLFNNFFTGIIPSSSLASSLSALKDLSLSANDLNGTIPASLGALTTLNVVAVAKQSVGRDHPTGIGRFDDPRMVDIEW